MKHFLYFQQSRHPILALDDYLQNLMYVMRKQLNEHNEPVLELKLLLSNEHPYDKAKSIQSLDVKPQKSLFCHTQYVNC